MCSRATVLLLSLPSANCSAPDKGRHPRRRPGRKLGGQQRAIESVGAAHDQQQHGQRRVRDIPEKPSHRKRHVIGCTTPHEASAPRGRVWHTECPRVTGP